jgi:hypothetical protein
MPERRGESTACVRAERRGESGREVQNFQCALPACTRTFGLGLSRSLSLRGRSIRFRLGGCIPPAGEPVSRAIAVAI